MGRVMTADNTATTGEGSEREGTVTRSSRIHQRWKNPFNFDFIIFALLPVSFFFFFKFAKPIGSHSWTPITPPLLLFPAVKTTVSRKPDKVDECLTDFRTDIN